MNKNEYLWNKYQELNSIKYKIEYIKNSPLRKFILRHKTQTEEHVLEKYYTKYLEDIIKDYELNVHFFNNLFLNKLNKNKIDHQLLKTFRLCKLILSREETINFSKIVDLHNITNPTLTQHFFKYDKFSYSFLKKELLFIFNGNIKIVEYILINKKENSINSRFINYLKVIPNKDRSSLDHLKNMINLNYELDLPYFQTYAFNLPYSEQRIYKLFSRVDNPQEIVNFFFLIKLNYKIINWIKKPKTLKMIIKKSIMAKKEKIQQNLDICIKENSFLIESPDSSEQLIQWSYIFNNCISNYINSIKKGDKNILIIRKNDKPFACATVTKENGLEEIKGKFNQEIPIPDIIKINEIIDNHLTNNS